MKKLIAILLVLTMVLGLCACGGAKVDEALLGTYTCYSAETEGMELPADMIFTEPCTIVLNANGKADFNLDGDEFTIDYTIDGNTIEMKDGSDTITGTIGDGQMEIDLMGVILYMSKDGAAPAAAAEEAPAEEASAEEASAEEAPAAGAFEPVSAEFANGTITVVGVELFKDSEDKPAFAVYYDFTNTSDSMTSPWWEVEYEVSQEGYELYTTYSPYEAELPYEDNESLNVLPGYTNRCVEMFAYNDQGGVIDFAIIDYNGDARIDLQIDPANVSGRPDDFVPTPVNEPTISADMTDTAEVNDGAGTIRIDHVEWTEGYDGEKILRVYAEYTNTSDVPDNCWANIYFYAFQDGVDLPYGYPTEIAPEEENLSTELQPGESIMVAEVFEIRSDSPVEVVFMDLWEEAGAAIMVPVE